ncbi:MAG: hypothetical protein EOO06_03760 [Chitinophagaceae bacterium]|nr:MAG: hypothetical protein EOO06_03760 [Chitinophagaceae bacterium]
MRQYIQWAFLASIIFYVLSCNPRNPEMSGRRISEVNRLYWLQNNFSSADSDSILHYSKLIDSAAVNLPAAYKAMAMIGRGRYYSGVKPDLSMKYYQQALDLVEGTGADSIAARAYNGVGVRHLKRSDYSAALDKFFKALALFEKGGNQASAGGVLSNIGEVYQLKNDVPSAKKYILRAMETNKRANNIRSYLDAAQTLANLYGMNNQFDSAIAIDRMGIAIADSIGSTRLKSSFYNNLGNCYMYSDRPDSARYYFTQCVALDSANGIWHFMVDNYLTLGQLALRQNSTKEAEHHFKRAIYLSDSVNENQLKVYAWKGLAQLYKKQNNFKQAIDATDSSTAAKDRMISEKSENKIAELQELYETGKKEQTIILQEVKLSRQRTILFAGLLLSASLLLSGWMFYRRYRIKKEKEYQEGIMQQREKATLDILHAEDKERRRIAAELHDGVGQVVLAAWMNLQAIEPQMNELPPPQQQALSRAIAMVGEGCREVREVSHSMMPNALLNKGLVGAVKDFTQQIDPNVINISFHTEGMLRTLDPMTETILYRIIQESVNNAIKHSGASELEIFIHHNSDGISLLIEDNGRGFDPSLVFAESNTQDGLGLKNIQSRLAFLDGTVEWDSSPGNGTVVTIFIPSKQLHA